MIRLFVRFSLVTLGATFTSFVLMTVFYGSAQDAFFKPRAALEMSRLASLLQEQLQDLPLEKVQEKLDEMTETSGFRGRMISTDEWATPKGNGIFVTLKDARYWVEIKPNESVVNEMETREGIAVLAALAAMIGLSLGSGIFLAVPLVRKLHSQERTLLRIAEGDLTARVEGGSRDALGRLGERINSMAERIQGLVQSHRDLIGTISHEMRTPVARLQFSLEMLDTDDSNARQQRITSMQEDIEELDELLEEILTFQRLETGTQPDLQDKISLPELLERIVSRVSNGNPHLPIRLVELRDAGLFSDSISCNERLLTRGIENVVRNAVRFANRGVVVMYEIQLNSMTVWVVDDGPGVPPQDRQRIFEPFVTLSGSTHKNATTGLGLAIAKHIIHHHRGTITVDDDDGSGAVFRMNIPIA